MVSCLKTSRTDVSRHRGQPGLQRCGGVESPSGHHRRRRRGPLASRGRRAPTASPRAWVYELLARYRAEGEAAFEPRSRRPQDLTDRHPSRDGRADPRAAQASWPRRASTPAPTPSPGTWSTTTRLQRVPGHDQPAPGRGRARRPRAEEATQVLLHPVRSRPCPTRPGSPTSPTTGSPAPTATRRRHRDPHLARRPLPLRPARHRPPPGHRPDRARPPSAKPLPSTASPPPR